jgi:hypothetical protein
MNNEPNHPERETAPIKTEPAEATNQAELHPQLRRLFSNRAALRRAMLAREILGPPKSESERKHHE